MTFIETPLFTRLVTRLLKGESYRALQNVLCLFPDEGSIIPGSGGLRKMRWSTSGRGKRGGLRVIYHWMKKREFILMLHIYPKNSQEDLTATQLKTLRKLVEEELDE